MSVASVPAHAARGLARLADRPSGEPWKDLGGETGSSRVCGLAARAGFADAVLAAAQDAASACPRRTGKVVPPGSADEDEW
jgi:hypothetical protein